MSSEQIEAATARLKRILRRCGWTIHLNHKPSGVYAGAVKRDVTGKPNWKYIAPLYAIDGMTTEKIVAVLPTVA